MRIPVLSPSRRFSIITSNSDTRLLSWVYLRVVSAHVGASFRNTGEILELAGCDFLTISPALLDELQKTQGKVEAKLNASQARDASIKKVSYIDNEADFRYIHLLDIIDGRFYFNEDQMAVEKLSDGIRFISVDVTNLENLLLMRLRSRISSRRRLSRSRYQV